jgi:superfamily II DNA/RNA helicase
VINFDPPADRDGYVHRVGRTGRAGRSGVGVTFVGAEHARDVERIAAELRLDREFAETELSSPARPGRAHPRSNGGGARPRSNGSGGGRRRRR